MSHYDVFISYSVKNSDTAFQLVECLEKRGLKCWIAPRDIKEGSIWAEEINEAIDHADNFVLIYSKESEASNQVPKEVGLASTSKKRMIPFKIDGTDLSGIYKYHLSDCQIVDASEQMNAKMEELADSLKQLRSEVEQMKAQKEAGEQSRLQKRRKIKARIAGIIGAVITVAVIILYFAVTSEYRSYDPDEEIFVFTANEDMTIKGFEEDREKLLGRLEEFFGDGLRIEEDMENFRIMASIPMEQAGPYDILALMDYFTMPGELYLADREDGFSDYLLIGRDEIESVMYIRGVAPELDLSGHGIGREEKCGYIEVQVSDYLAGKVEAATQEWEGVAIHSDIEMANRSNIITEDMIVISEQYYYNEDVAVTDSGKRICFYLPEGDERVGRLMVHILENAPMTQCFEEYHSVPVYWETKEASLAYGANQKPVKELKGPVIDAVYTGYGTEDLSDGQWMDIRQEWKRRLDCLGLPYAFGVSTQGKNQVAVRFQMKDVNNELLALIPLYSLSASGWDFSLDGLPDTDGASYTFTDFTYWEGAKGSYLATMKIMDPYKDELTDMDSEYVELAVRSGVLDEKIPIVSGSAEAGRVEFNASLLDKDGRITEKAMPFLKSLSYIVNEGGELPYSYDTDASKAVIRSLKDAQRLSGGEWRYGLSYEKTEQDYKELVEKISRIGGLKEAVTRVSMTFDGSCNVYLDVRTGDSFPEEVIVCTRQLLKDCGLENTRKAAFYFTEEEEGERARILYSSKSREEGGGDVTHLTCIFLGDRIDRHVEALKEGLAGDGYLSSLGYEFKEDLDFE